MIFGSISVDFLLALFGHNYLAPIESKYVLNLQFYLLGNNQIMRKFIANILPKSCHVCLCSWFHVCKIDHDHDFWLHWSAWGANAAAPVSPFIFSPSPTLE